MATTEGEDMISSQRPDPRVIVALDYPDAETAWQLVGRLSPQLCRLKVGKELFTGAGPDFVRKLVERGFDVFLDLKFHDIPTTVEKACRAATQLGVWMLNVHALGGERMLLAAREAVSRSANPPLLVAVTILTSMDGNDLVSIGLTGTPQETVMRLARLARTSGLDGVVCSSREAAELRERFGEGFVLVTPGIRLPGDQVDDQRRIMTPADAVRNGSTYLVMGRPVTRADDPAGVLLTINSELAALR
jgi:orotidine-5'-phosphate decarboxylase